MTPSIAASASVSSAASSGNKSPVSATDNSINFAAGAFMPVAIAIVAIVGLGAVGLVLLLIFRRKGGK